MPGRRKLIFANNEIYHIYNKTINNEEILNKNNNIRRFLNLIDYYRFKTPVRYSKKSQNSSETISKTDKSQEIIKIYAYAIMPNHFHLLLKQLKDNGIRNYLSIIQNSYARYYNLLNDRVGGLFIRPFKAKRVENDNLFLHISRYIHLNPVTSYLINPEDLYKSNLTSLPKYLNSDNINDDTVDTKLIISLMGSRQNYLKFIKDQESYQKKIQSLKHLIFE